MTLFEGYARSAYFYSLLSGFGMFVLGSTFVMYNAIQHARHLTDVVPIDYGWITWGTLGVSFVIDGFVLSSALLSSHRNKDANESLWHYIKNSKDRKLSLLRVCFESEKCLHSIPPGRFIGGLCGMSWSPGCSWWCRPFSSYRESYLGSSGKVGLSPFVFLRADRSLPADSLLFC